MVRLFVETPAAVRVMVCFWEIGVTEALTRGVTLTEGETETVGLFDAETTGEMVANGVGLREASLFFDGPTRITTANKITAPMRKIMVLFMVRLYLKNDPKKRLGVDKF